MQTIAFHAYAAFFRKSTQNSPSLSAPSSPRGNSVTMARTDGPAWGGPGRRSRMSQFPVVFQHLHALFGSVA